MRINGRDYSHKKRYFDGTHRTCSPAETLARYLPVMGQFGVTRLANVTGLDVIGVPVYVGIRPNGRCLSVSQGKGIDNDSAKASALMEAIEGWHAENINLALRYESHSALDRNHRLVEVEGLSRWPGRVFQDDRPMLWVEGWDLLQKEPTWVPFDSINLNFVVSTDRYPIFVGDSNGLASGNHFLEAVSHALCELIERDGTTLWFADTRDSDKATQLDPTSVDHAVCREVLDRLEKAGLIVGMYDATSDLGIPIYHALIVDRPGTPRAMGYFWGFGCHLDPGVALSRALTEAVQCRLTEITGHREDVKPGAYQENRDEDELREMGEMVTAVAPTRQFGDRNSLACDTLEGDVEFLLEALRRAGIESAVVVDLTRPGMDVPVVRAMVPELEPPFVAEYYTPGKRARRLLEEGEASG